MDEERKQLIKDVADLKQRVANQGEQLELQAAQLKLLTAPPPVETTTKRPFGLKSHTPNKS